MFILALLVGPLPLEARLFIVEIHYNPAEASDAEAPHEFLEIYNDEALRVDIGGYTIEGGVDYRFPEGTWVEARSVVVAAADPDEIKARGGLTSGVHGPWTGRLDNGGEELRLVDTGGSVVARVPYNDRGRWPAAPDGEGPSLVLRSEMLDPTEGESWGWSPASGGSPGTSPFAVAEIEAAISEVYRGPGGSWAELHNQGSAPLDVGGYQLDLGLDGGTAYALPSPSILGARDYLVVDLAAAGIPLPLLDSRVVLRSPGGGRVVDARRLEAQDAAGSSGLLPVGDGRWFRLDVSTPGSANAAPATPPVVISEIHYHPYSEDDADELIELVNAGGTTVDLGGLAFTTGIHYTFPAPTPLAPGAYLVLAKDPARIEAAYGITGVHGPFEGVLADGGEMLRLGDLLGRPVDEVHYRDDGNWPRWPDGDGPSLELVDLRQDNSVGSAWQESEHEAVSGWKTYEYSRRLLDLPGDQELHLYLLGAGEVLIDDLELVPAGGGTNLLREGGFDGPAAASVWVFDGSHVESRIEPGKGPGGSSALHLAASARGDSYVNHIEQSISGLRAATDYTVRFKARWLRGADLVMTRLWGHALAQATRLEVPHAGGTPGKPSSRARENTGPVISQVSQEPALPAPAQAVFVRARVQDPDGVAGVEVRFRPDGVGGFEAALLLDDGSAPDEVGGDGMYAASITPSVPSGALAEFYITAWDAQGAERSFPPGAPAETFFYGYADGLTSHPLPAYRLLFRARDYSTLTSRSVHSNHLLPAALVIDDRRIVHRVEARYKGSPVVRPIVETLEHLDFRLHFESEDSLHGGTRLVLDGSIPDAGYQADRTVNHLMKAVSRRSAGGGVPYGDRGYVHLIVNGRNFGVFEHVIPIDGDYLERSFGDDGGELYKVDNHYEVNDGGSSVFLKRSWSFSSEKEDLRFTFKKRSREKEDDYSGLIQLLQVLDPNQTPNGVFDARLGELVDVESWLRAIAVYRTAGDWDAPGGETGKNVYLYRPPGGLWAMIPWDHDVALGAWPPSPGPNEASTAPIHSSDFPMISRLMRRPAFERELTRSIQYLLGGVYSPADLGALRESTHTFLSSTVAARLTVCPVTLVPERPCYEYPSRMRDFTTARWRYLTGAIADPRAFTIATGAGQRFATTEPQAALVGTAPMAVESIEWDGRPLAIDWRTRDGWMLTVDLAPGLNVVRLVGLDRGGAAVGEVSIEIVFDPTAFPFQRGDANSDGGVDIADPLRLLFQLFAGVDLGCPRAADADDDGRLAITDAIRLLNYLFLGGAAPEKPFPAASSPACGLDTTPDDLGCVAPPVCAG